MAASGSGGGDGVPTLPLSTFQNPKVASLHFIELRYYLTNIYFTRLARRSSARVRTLVRACDWDRSRLPTYVIRERTCSSPFHSFSFTHRRQQQCYVRDWGRVILWILDLKLILFLTDRWQNGTETWGKQYGLSSLPVSFCNTCKGI